MNELEKKYRATVQKTQARIDKILNDAFDKAEALAEEKAVPFRFEVRGTYGYARFTPTTFAAKRNELRDDEVDMDALIDELGLWGHPFEGWNTSSLSC